MNDDSSCALCCSACPCVLSITGITTTGFSSFLQYFLHRSPRRHSLRLFENNDKVRSKASCFKPWIKCALCLFLVKKWILHAQLRFLAAPSSTGNVRTKPLVCKWFLFYKKKTSCSRRYAIPTHFSMSYWKLFTLLKINWTLFKLRQAFFQTKCSSTVLKLFCPEKKVEWFSFGNLKHLATKWTLYEIS